MRNINKLALAAMSSALLISSCNSGDGFKTTENGLQYKIVKDEKSGETAKEGDVVVMHLHTMIGDSTVFDSRKFNGNQPVEYPLNAPTFKGDVPEGIMMMSAGDSAIFKVSLDSIKKTGAQTLPWMQDGDMVTYYVNLVAIKGKAEIDKEMQEQRAQAEKQMQTDDLLLQEYFTKNGIKAEKSASGIYYQIQTQGTGNNIQPGQVVSINYTGKTLDGKIFDSNVEPGSVNNQPLTFRAASGEMIAGMDEGMTYLKKGSKAKLYIPSPLAYGPQSPTPDIAPNSVLIFEVEVLDVK